jgi:hypothetical protein
MRKAIEYYLADQSQVEPFGKWAFGDGYEELDHSLKFMEKWNELHGDDLTLKPDGMISKDIPKMIALWTKT